MKAGFCKKKCIGFKLWIIWFAAELICNMDHIIWIIIWKCCAHDQYLCRF